MRHDYLPRVIDSELQDLLSGLPAIAIEGPKAVGKTESALRRAKTVQRLDDPELSTVGSADPRILLKGDPPVLLDEWQRVPPVWDLVRRAVDQDSSPGRFLLTRSATPTNPTTHSGAGRIVTLRMRPLTLAERQIAEPSVSLRDLVAGANAPVEGRTTVDLEQYVEEILASGFPALRGLSSRHRRIQLDGYLTRIVDTDFPELGLSVRKPQGLRRWMTAYAAATATTASYEKIRDAATGGEGDKPARSTTLPYRDVLERLWILDPVPAWTSSRNRLKRLAYPPKHHLADPALAARLLGVTATSLLSGKSSDVPMPRDGTFLGGMFESLVTLCVRVFAQAAECSVGHLRTRGGRHEIALIVERADQRVIAVEVKLSPMIRDEDVTHLKWLKGELGANLIDSVVVTTGTHAYRRKDGIAVVPAALLGP
jgi:uncharacterized protein